ncbi:MAG: hypothetical protein R2786_06355 [Flavobacteriaceae bacterium]
MVLKIEAEKEIRPTLLDSLNLNFQFENYTSLKAEVDSLSLQFQKIGFIDSELKKLVKKNDSLFEASYFLGNQWEQIEVHYRKEDFPISELKKLIPNATDSVFTIPFFKTEAILWALTKQKVEKGDPFSKVQLSNIQKKDSLTLTAVLNATSNNKRTIDGFVIKGYEKFPKPFLKYYAGIKKGATFNQKKLIQKNELLNSLGFASTVKPPEALFKKDSTLIYFYLEKLDNNLFDGILGFATNEETQKIEFNGYLSLELNNNLNYGEQLSINYKADGREQQNLRIFTKLPYLFKSPFGISMELELFKRDSTFSTTHQEARLYYQATPKLDFYAGYKSYESNNLLNEANANIVVEDFTSKFALLGIHYTQLQNQKLFPIKTFAGLESEIGNRSTSSNNSKQAKFSGTVYHIFNLNEKNSLFIKNHTRFLNSPNYITNELFRFGGVNSLRGFRENSIDASLFSVLNTEYRYLLDDNAYVHSIFDLGYFENKIININEELYGFGLGFGLNTKAGLFKFNIANGFSNNQNIEFKNTRIHIIYITRF